jgi:hypothetical protein
LLGALLVLLCGTGVAVYASNVGHRHAVLVVVRPVSAGAVIRTSDLSEARISSDPQIHAVPAAERDRIVGRVTAVNLVPGTLLTRAQLASGPLVGAGSAVVGLALKAGQLPSGVRSLDRVTLVETVSGSAAGGSLAAPGSVLVASATVSSVQQSSDGQTMVVSVVVPTDQAPTVAAAAARDEVTLILLGGGSGP